MCENIHIFLWPLSDIWAGNFQNKRSNICSKLYQCIYSYIKFILITLAATLPHRKTCIATIVFIALNGQFLLENNF